MRAAHPSSQPSILLHSLLLSLHTPLLLLVHGNHTSSYEFSLLPPPSPVLLCHFLYHTYLLLSSLCLLNLAYWSHQQLAKWVWSNTWNCNQSNLRSTLLSLWFLFCCHSFFFLITVPGRILSLLPLPCYVLTNTHTHMNYTISALFLLSLQASQCLLKCCCSCSTPPTCNIDSSENHLPLLILLSPHFSVFTHSLWVLVLSSLLSLCPPLAHPSFPAVTEEQISLSLLPSASLSPHQTTGKEKIIRDIFGGSLGWSMPVFALDSLYTWTQHEAK